jgi:hypothetical protein
MGLCVWRDDIHWGPKLLTPLIKMSKYDCIKYINYKNTELYCMLKTIGNIYYFILIQLLKEVGVKIDTHFQYLTL